MSTQTQSRRTRSQQERDSQNRFNGQNHWATDRTRNNRDIIAQNVNDEAFETSQNQYDYQEAEMGEE